MQPSPWPDCNEARGPVSYPARSRAAAGRDLDRCNSRGCTDCCSSLNGCVSLAEPCFRVCNSRVTAVVHDVFTAAETATERLAGTAGNVQATSSTAFWLSRCGVVWYGLREARARRIHLSSLAANGPDREAGTSRSTQIWMSGNIRTDTQRLQRPKGCWSRSSSCWVLLGGVWLEAAPAER